MGGELHTQETMFSPEFKILVSNLSFPPQASQAR